MLEAKVIKAARRGVLPAFELLYLRYVDIVHLFLLLRLGGTPSENAERVDEIFRESFKELARRTPSSGLGRILYGKAMRILSVENRPKEQEYPLSPISRLPQNCQFPLLTDIRPEIDKEALSSFLDISLKEIERLKIRAKTLLDIEKLSKEASQILQIPSPHKEIFLQKLDQNRPMTNWESTGKFLLKISLYFFLFLLFCFLLALTKMGQEWLTLLPLLIGALTGTLFLLLGVKFIAFCNRQVAILQWKEEEI